MEYKVVCVNSTSSGTEKTSRDLEAQVNALIKQGWKPQGGICCHSTLYQAMVK